VIIIKTNRNLKDNYIDIKNIDINGVINQCDKILE